MKQPLKSPFLAFVANPEPRQSSVKPTPSVGRLDTAFATG